jgi:hypothetical protein
MPFNHYSDITLIPHCSHQNVSIVILKLMELEWAQMTSKSFVCKLRFSLGTVILFL